MKVRRYPLDELYEFFVRGVTLVIFTVLALASYGLLDLIWKFVSDSGSLGLLLLPIVCIVALIFLGTLIMFVAALVYFLQLIAEVLS